MKKLARPTLVAALLVGLAGCHGLPVDMSGHTVNERSQIDPYQGKRISAQASGFQLALFIPLNINDRQKRAFEQLRREAGDRLLADVTITESWSWAFVGTVHTTRIDATAYPRKAESPK